MAKSTKSKKSKKAPDAYTDANYQILPNLEAIEAFNSKMTGVSYSYLDVLAHEHAVAFTVAKMMDEDLLAETKSAISSALENGTDFRDFQKRLKPYLMKQGWWGEKVTADPLDGKKKTVQLGSTRRLRTIYQTNLHSAYSAGQWERIEQTKDALPYLQYMPSVAERKREDHKKYYNMVRPATDAIWQYIMPPNGYHCLCWIKQLTQKQAEKAGITPDEDAVVEFEEYENPRTGQKIDVPVGITPSFAHNAGDRLGALMQIAEDKHGSEFAKQLQGQLDDFVMRLAQSSSTVTMADFSTVAVQHSEVDRLLIDLADDVPKRNEAMAGVEYQSYFDVTLERPMPTVDDFGNKIAGYDYDVIDTQEKLDFMFTMYGESERKIINLNRFFAHTDTAWEVKKATILNHLQKADIVPIDLRYLEPANRVKIVSYILSLSKNQQEKILFIHGLTK